MMRLKRFDQIEANKLMNFETNNRNEFEDFQNESSSIEYDLKLNHVILKAAKKIIQYIRPLVATILIALFS